MTRFLFIFFAFFCLFHTGYLSAAKPSGLDKPGAKPEIYALKTPIEQAQILLKELGFYKGDIDGKPTKPSVEAVLKYQKKHKLKETGVFSPQLLQHLQNIGRIQALIQRLEKVRTTRKEEARLALLSDPRTRLLLDPKKHQTADPTRDASVCFKTPTSVCLLNEAVESSRAVFEDDLRDWALGEILAAQVRIGLDQDAMKTAARIKDSRLIIAALTTIAKAHVKEGKLAEAVSSLDLIPVVERRLSVMLDIAQVYQDKGDIEKLNVTIKQIIASSEAIIALEKRLPLQIQAAEILAQNDKKKAQILLDNVTNSIRISTINGSKVTLLRHAASAMANIQYPEAALKALDELPDDETRIPVLMAATRSFLKMKRFDAALNTVKRISADRYRSVMFSDIAFALWQDGQHSTAHKILLKARTITNGILLPFAKNFALSQISNVMIVIARDTKETKFANLAFTIISSISDGRLKARGLWDLAHAANLHGFSISNEDIDSEAKLAINNIKSNFSRAWMLGDLASTHHALGENASAQKAFDMGLKTAQNLTNPWARSRALAKFGAVMNSLD